MKEEESEWESIWAKLFQTDEPAQKNYLSSNILYVYMTRDKGTGAGS